MDGSHSGGILPAASTMLGPGSSAEAPWTTSGLLYAPSNPGILSLQYSQIDRSNESDVSKEVWAGRRRSAEQDRDIGRLS